MRCSWTKSGSQALLPALRKARGRVVFMSSIGGLVAHALTAARPRTRYLVGVDAKLLARLRRLTTDRFRDRFLALAIQVQGGRRRPARRGR